mgnify:CR=1 FL=1
MDPVINPAPVVEVPTPAPIEAPVTQPAPAPIPEQKKGFLTPEKMEIAQMVVLGAIFASFIVQIYYYKKKALEESDFVKFEERIKNLENKVLE